MVRTNLVHRPDVLYFLYQLKFQTLGQPDVINGIKPLPALGLSIMTFGNLVPKFEKAFYIKYVLSKLWDKFWDRFGTNFSSLFMSLEYRNFEA